QDPKKEQQKRNTRESHGQTRREFFTQAQTERESFDPIEQRRLLEPWLAPQSRRNPVTRPSHFASDRGVARLIRPEQPNACQIEKIEQEYNRQSQQHSRHRARHRFHGRTGVRACLFLTSASTLLYRAGSEMGIGFFRK